MNFITIQIIIFISIILSSLLGGKKGAIISTLVWLVTTFIMKKGNYLGSIQFITLALSFQLGMITGVVKDFIQKKIKVLKSKKKQA